MGWDAPWHWVILAILVIALFGYKKLPDAARAMGRSLRIFKTEIKGMSDDDKAREAARVHQLDQQQTVQPPSQQAAAPAATNTPAAPLQGAPMTMPSSTPVTTPVPGEDPRP